MHDSATIQKTERPLPMGTPIQAPIDDDGTLADTGYRVGDQALSRYRYERGTPVMVIGPGRAPHVRTSGGWRLVRRPMVRIETGDGTRRDQSIEDLEPAS